MIDSTENDRRQLVAEIYSVPGTREYLEAKHGEVWDRQQLQKAFDVLGFAAPFVIVCRKSDGVRGSLSFQANPRLYFDFCEG